ncbi:MAG: hypothetical protein Kow0063_06850 [Anaerolineae bacterium]
MKSIGLCTHFTQTDEWAFDYALKLAQTHGARLNICHWLESPYTIRRDIVYNDLFKPTRTVNVTPELLTRLELQLREYYEPRLGDFTEVAFKLCEGAYQVELVRCFRQHLLDLVVMGHQPASEQTPGEGRPLEEFAAGIRYPIVVVGLDGPGSFLLNQKAFDMLDQLALKEGSWKLIQPALALN